MVKITFMGAGSTIFAKNILGDAMLTPVLSEAHIALYDIDAVRLNESKLMLDTLNANINGNRATITAHLGVQRRREALAGSVAAQTRASRRGNVGDGRCRCMGKPTERQMLPEATGRSSPAARPPGGGGRAASMKSVLAFRRESSSNQL